MDAIGLIQSFLSSGQYRILRAGSSDVVPLDATLCIINVNTAEVADARPSQVVLVLTKGSSASMAFRGGNSANTYIAFSWNDTGIEAAPGGNAPHTFWEYIWLG